MEHKHKNFDDNLVKCIAQIGVSFHAIESQSFKDLVKVADRRLITKDPTTVSRHVTKYSNNILSNVCDIISAVKTYIIDIGVSSDIWTSKARDSYVSLTASFIDKKFHMCRYVPFVKHFPMVNIGLGLDNMIRSPQLQSIPSLKHCSVNDNASNYRVAIREYKYF